MGDRAAILKDVPRPAPRQKIPTDLLCPLTKQLFVEPVIAGDGQTYERAAIEEWLKTHGTSPGTKDPLSPTFFPNNHMKGLITRLVKNVS